MRERARAARTRCTVCTVHLLLLVLSQVTIPRIVVTVVCVVRYLTFLRQDLTMKISVSPWYKILYQGTGCSTGKRLPQITSVFASFACPLSNFYIGLPRLVFFFCGHVTQDPYMRWVCPYSQQILYSCINNNNNNYQYYVIIIIIIVIMVSIFYT